MTRREYWKAINIASAWIVCHGDPLEAPDDIADEYGDLVFTECGSLDGAREHCSKLAREHTADFSSAYTADRFAFDFDRDRAVAKTIARQLGRYLPAALALLDSPAPSVAKAKPSARARKGAADAA